MLRLYVNMRKDEQPNFPPYVNSTLTSSNEERRSSYYGEVDEGDFMALCNWLRDNKSKFLQYAIVSGEDTLTSAYSV